MSAGGATSGGGAGYRIPSLGYRILVGGLRLVPWILLLVGLPVGVLTYANSRGIALPVSILTVTAFGIALAVLSTLRYVLKPTRLFGPVSMLTSGVTIAYLLQLLAASPYRFAIPRTGAGIGLGFASLVVVLLLVPILALASGLVTTIEDLRSPRERLPFDFPP